jgi:type IV fimbrial biogenesis protein FimT
MKFRSNAAGVTIVELMAVLGIAAILLSVGVPSFNYVSNINRISSEVNDLLGAMQFARLEAIKEGQTVTVCPSANGTSCLASTSWNGGWIVFSDPANVGTVDPGEAVLRVRTAFSSADTAASDNGVNAVTFNRDGFALNLPALITVKFHDPTNNAGYTRCLAVSLVGSMTTQAPAAGNNCT